MEELEKPVPMIIHCPMCRERHIDRGIFAQNTHHTHACQYCGHVWRPAIIATVGVQYLPGFKDNDGENDGRRQGEPSG
jgi:rubredoxin